MEKVDQASIDVETLEASLQGNLATSRALSEKCCIYRVPQKIRCFNPNAYTPQVVSIGPYHRGKEQLKSMEGHKKTYLHYFLERTNNKIGLKDCLQLIKSKEIELRDCYSETIDFSSDDFVTMILIDAVFLIEVLLRASHSDLRSSDDHLFEKPWIASLMWPDLWLLENQLPLFIICDLFDLVQEHYRGLDLITLTRQFASYVLQRLLIENDLIDLYFPDAAHFLDLLRLSSATNVMWSKYTPYTEHTKRDCTS